MVRGASTRRRTVILGLAILAVVVALVSGAVLVSGALRSGPDRYDDGIPRTWQGQPVLRGQAALDFAKATTDAMPFLVAFWAGIESRPGCAQWVPAQDQRYACRHMTDVGDQPGVVSAGLSLALRVDTSNIAPGPVIARVHSHDPSLDGCTPDYAAACEASMVGEAIVWSGDVSTAPHPTTAEQAAAAFAVSGPSSGTDTSGFGKFPGVALIPFPPIDNEAVDDTEGVAVVFPSPAALAAAAPDVAAKGESDVLPQNNLWGSVGSERGSDPRRGPGGFTFKMHWLARGNVLVGVRDDASLGPQADPYVKVAREDLAKLPR
jgi:hypothetical protein